MTISLTFVQAHHVVIAPHPETKTFVKETVSRPTTYLKEVKFLPFVTSYIDTAYEYNHADRWYCARDYANFKAEIDRDVERLRSLNPKAVRLLKHLMKKCIMASNDTHRLGTTGGETTSDVTIFQRLMTQHPRMINCLQKMIQAAPYIIGLHKYCVQFLIQDKETRRFDIVEAVYNTQSAPMHPMGSGIVPDGTCQKISGPSRLFAQMIGHMAAMAAS